MSRHAFVTAGAALALLVGAVGAQAQSTAKGSVVQNSNAMQSADQADMTHMNMRQQIQSQMTKDGLTDVTVMPSSFYVRAKDKKGDPIAMVIGPDSFTEVTELPAGGKTANGMSGSSSTGAASTAK